MKLTKIQLQKIIKEEIGKLNEAKASFLSKLSTQAKRNGWKETSKKKGNVITVTYQKDATPKEKWIIEIEYDLDDPEWYGWAGGHVRKNGKPNWEDSGNDPIEDTSIIQDFLNMGTGG